MTLTTTATTWTVASAFDAYTAYMARCSDIAEAIGFDYNPMIGSFYNASGELTSEFNVGFFAFYVGLHRDQLTSHEMKLGFDDAHRESVVTYKPANAELADLDAGMSFDEWRECHSYRNEPGFAESGAWF